MLQVNDTGGTLQRLDPSTMTDLGMLERGDLQRMICADPAPFFHELGEPLFFVGEEVKPSEHVDDRIDVLAIDRNGSAVVIELKRAADKWQHLQGISYAAMIAKWDADRFAEEYARHHGGAVEAFQENLDEFLLEHGDSDGNEIEINAAQRVVLVAEGFHYEVLASAQWLSDTYSFDIACYKLMILTNEAGRFIALTKVFPVTPIEEEAVQRRRKTRTSRRKAFADWETALEQIENPAVVDFFRSELRRGVDSYLGNKRRLTYRVGRAGRINVHAHNKHAYVWQHGRFDGDVEFWRDQIGTSADVELKADDDRLRFYLRTVKDFERFLDAVENTLPTIEFRTVAQIKRDRDAAATGDTG